MTDYKAEAREFFGIHDFIPGEQARDVVLCARCQWVKETDNHIGSFGATQRADRLAALLERLCGEAREAERKLHEPRIIQSPGFHIDPEDEA